MGNAPNQHDQNSTGRSAGGKRGLDPKWYLDPAVFEYEKKNLFGNSWVLLGHTSQLATVGSFCSFEVNGTPIVLVRDSDDSVRSFLNVCQHRGTQLCHEATGQSKSNHLVCPYHGWKYNLQGELVAAPNMSNVEGFSLNDFSLPEVGIYPWNGFLFVYPDSVKDNRCDLDGLTDNHREPAINRLGFLQELYPFADYVHIKTISYDVAANWKLFFQNFNECYHCPSVHPQLTPYSDYRDSENDFDEGEVLGGPMKIRETAETISADGTLCGSLPGALAESERRNARYYTLFPNLFFSLFPDYVMVHRIQPIERDRTRIDCDFLFAKDTVESAGFESTKATEFWDLTNRQDWEMCERVQKGIGTPGFQPSPYSNLESLLAAFDGYYRDQMSGFSRQRQD